MSILSGLFIALVLAAALTFGFVILVWVFAVLVAFTLFFYLREMIRRWWFMRTHPTPKTKRRGPEIIEVEYIEITDTEDKK